MLEAKIRDRSATVGVIGLGYVGLPVAHAFTCAGFRVLGFDTDATKVEALGHGRNYIGHLGDGMTREMHASGRFRATADFGELGAADAVLICVPTPLGRHEEPDLRFVRSSARSVAATLRPGQLVVLESTTYPGTTREVVGAVLAESGLEAGTDYLLAYSPERQDPGRAGGDVRSVPKLVGGTCERSGAVAHELYAAALDRVLRVSSAEVAEAAKLLENVFRSVNIALVNELKVILAAMDVDVWEVVEAAATKPFGFMRFEPGPGLGGHCIPVDPFYLSWAARRVGHSTKFVELAGEINTRMPEYVVQCTLLALNRRRKAVHGSRILVLGLAYKADVDDVRESPAVTLIERFAALGATVDYADPHVPVPPPMRDHDLSAYRSVELTAASVAGYDAVVVATAHAAFDWELVAEHAALVVDTRNALAGRMGASERYVRA